VAASRGKSPSVDAFLRGAAEPEAAAADKLEGEFGHALVVPAYAETDVLFSLLSSVPDGPLGRVLIVLVLNARASAPQEAHEANESARARVAEVAPKAVELSADPPIVTRELPRGTLVVVDRATKGHFFPAGQGIGLARKIGHDFIVRAISRGRIASDWIHGTDADALLPNDYFEQTEQIDDASAVAAVYAFQHRFGDDAALALAGRLEEIRMRYWTLGLAWAGSPYAFPHLGSLLAVRSEAYAAAGGFPKKDSLEDIAMLDTLARLGGIVRLAGSPVVLSGRVSERVPAGSTGRAVSELAASGAAAPRLPHPVAFAHLAAWLRVLAAIARTHGDMEAALSEMPSGNPYFDAAHLQEALERIGAFAAVREAIAAETDPDRLLRALHGWFDAFRTRELIEQLGRLGMTPLPWRQALSEAPFTGLTASTDDDPEMLRQSLALQEAVLSVSPAGVPAMELDRA
jgi:hypothetical protein